MGTNLPREKISWFPTINVDACLGDRACYEFCKNDVFVWDEENQRPIVQNPTNCVVGCESCAQLCPSEAITFPSKEELRATLRRLREEMKRDQEAAPAAPAGSGQPEIAGER
jgi:NAD-dependent dihydropyrimidine dehydrogenase PreA subunit